MNAVFAMALAVSLFAAPVQITVNPTAVRVGTAADIQITWTQPMPADAVLQWTTTAGDAYGNGVGGYEYVAPEEPGRTFIHLAVTAAGVPWAECSAPVQVYRQFVVLKADDFGFASLDHYQRLLNYADAVRSRGIKTSLGMIAEQCQNPGAKARDKIMGMARGGFVEFWNHGYNHAHYLASGAKGALCDAPPGDDIAEKDEPAGAGYEFQGRPYEEQLDHLTRAQQTILDTYGFRMRAFGAPFNKTDANTVKALHDLGQIDTWIFGTLPDPNLHQLPRGGGEIESGTGVPSMATFLATHDKTSSLVVLQHHPGQATFIQNWTEFTGILDQISSDGGTFILPGESVDLLVKGIVPCDPKEPLADPALELAVREALNQWGGPIDPAAAAGLTSFQYTGRAPQLRSLIGIGMLSGVRQFDLRGNALPDAGPLVDLWNTVGGEMTVLMQDNPLSEDFVCNQIPLLDAKGLHIAFDGPCDNVALKLAVNGQGTLVPAAGDHAVPRNAALTVHASPAPGWKFDSWEGAPEAVPGSPDLTITPAAHRSITARFVKMSGFAVVVESPANGTVAVSPAQPQDGYAPGTTVTVTATPNTGYAFLNWTGDLTGTTANPASVVVDATKTVGAVFAANSTLNIKTAAQRLLDGFAAADTDHSGGLGTDEAFAAMPGLTEDQFTLLDVDGDGQLTLDDLNRLLNPGGCNCGKSDFTLDGLKGRLADFFLAGLALLALAALGAHGRRV